MHTQHPPTAQHQQLAVLPRRAHLAPTVREHGTRGGSAGGENDGTGHILGSGLLNVIDAPEQVAPVVNAGIILVEANVTEFGRGLFKRVLDDATIDELERILEVTFPADFRHVMQRCHGGVPVERSDFYYEHPSIGRRFRSGIGALMTLYLDQEGSILATLHSLGIDDQLPDRVIPFADDGGGDMMCLDYRHDPDNPRIVYWAHEEEKSKSIIPLADSFSAFLDNLLPPSTP